MRVHVDRATARYHVQVRKVEAEVLRRSEEDFGIFRWDPEVDLGGTYFRIDSRMKACFQEPRVDGFAREESLRMRTPWGSGEKVVVGHHLPHQDPCGFGRRIALDPERS